MVAATAISIVAMLCVRRRAPDGSYFHDGDRAAGVFGVLATGFAALLGFVVFLEFTSYDAARAGAESERRSSRNRSRPRSCPSQWKAIESIAEKLTAHRESSRSWVRRAEVDDGRCPGLTSEERERLKRLERENKELRRANEIPGPGQ